MIGFNVEFIKIDVIVNFYVIVSYLIFLGVKDIFFLKYLSIYIIKKGV